MRDKFSELIKQGVANFQYTPITGSIPEQDPICRLYNNIFSIPSDTHMSCLENGDRIITGHMVNTDDWKKFVISPCWGAVNFKTSGYWSLCDFLCNYGLCGEIQALNGDVVYYIKESDPEQAKISDRFLNNIHSCYMGESKIPQPITRLTTDGKIEHIKECLDSEDPIKSLNESHYILGNSWINYNGRIMGLVNNTVVLI